MIELDQAPKVVDKVAVSAPWTPLLRRDICIQTLKFDLRQVCRSRTTYPMEKTSTTGIATLVRVSPEHRRRDWMGHINFTESVSFPKYA